jgi:hypothetical protein
VPRFGITGAIADHDDAIGASHASIMTIMEELFMNRE